MTNKQSGNVVELVDGIICYAQIGDQAQENAVLTVQALLFLAGGMEKVKMLVDYSKSGKIGKDTIKSGLHAMQSIDFDKIAIFGASKYLVDLIKSLAFESGTSDVIRFFNNREEALEALEK